MASVSFSVGETFSSFKEFENKISEYQKAKCVQLYRRDSRTIEKSLGRFPNKSFNSEIKYTNLTYSCIHGGRNFKSKGNGKRTNSTFKMGCPASIKLKTSSDGQNLVVSSLDEEHNHTINYSLFSNLFHQRRLDETEKENVSNMLKVKANVKIIQTQLMHESGKQILLKDIHNIKTLNADTNNDLTILQRAVNTLSEMNGAFVKLITDDSNELRGLFFQDKRMRDTFARYPEFLCIDATYKLNDLRMPCYILLVENGNGQSEMVGMWLVADETEQMISEVVGLFKEHNPKWEDVKVVMSDKDFVERDVFRRNFPEARLKICLFHVLRTFKREITTEKMNISSNERQQILDIIQKIAYARSNAEYEKLRASLIQTGCVAVNAYFNNSWHPIRNEWVVGLSSADCLGNQTNNRLESLNQKLKQVISKHSRLNGFATDFVAFLGTHRTEIDGKLSRAAVKVPIHSSSDEDRVKYRQLLTQYAYGLVEKQLDKADKESVESYAAETYKYRVEVDKCTCAFHIQYRLPCCHIFALRRSTDHPIFDAALAYARWTKAYYLQGMNSSLQPTEVMTSTLSRKTQPKSQQQKFRAASQICQKIASCASEATGNEFTVKLNQLQALLASWERGDDVTLDIIPREHAIEDAPELEITEIVNDEEIDNANVVSEEQPETATQVQIITEQEDPEIETAIEGSLDPLVVAQAGGTDDAERLTGTGEGATSEVSAQPSMSSISLPANIKKRGRPKGSEQTVIGLPRKRLKLTKKVKGPQPFDNLPDHEKAKVILSWFVDGKSIADFIGNDKRLPETTIECDPNKIFLGATDVPLAVTKPYLEDDAWEQLQCTVNQLENLNLSWHCKVCASDLETRCVGCDSCLNWFHYHCAGISNSPKAQNWFCDDCKKGNVKYMDI